MIYEKNICVLIIALALLFFLSSCDTGKELPPDDETAQTENSGNPDYGGYGENNTDSGRDEGTNTFHSLLMYEEPDGTPYYAFNADFDFEKGLAVFPYAHIRLSSGAFYSSEINPELFSGQERLFTGQRPGAGDYYTVEENDTVNGMTVSSAETVIPFSFREDGSFSVMSMSKTVSLSGEIELNGILRYYAGEKYGSKGELTFIPDSSYQNYPDPTSQFRDYVSIGTADFFTDDSGEVSEGAMIYSDAPEFILGSYSEDYNNPGELRELIGDGSKSCSANVLIVFDSVKITWNSQFGCRAHARPVSVKLTGSEN